MNQQNVFVYQKQRHIRWEEIKKTKATQGDVDGIRVKIHKYWVPKKVIANWLFKKYGCVPYHKKNYMCANLPFQCNSRGKICQWIHDLVGDGIWGIYGFNKKGLFAGVGGSLFAAQLKLYPDGLRFFVEVDRITEHRWFKNYDPDKRRKKYALSTIQNLSKRVLL